MNVRDGFADRLAEAVIDGIALGIVRIADDRSTTAKEHLIEPSLAVRLDDACVRSETVGPHDDEVCPDARGKTFSSIHWRVGGAAGACAQAGDDAADNAVPEASRISAKMSLDMANPTYAMTVRGVARNLGNSWPTCSSTMAIRRRVDRP
jgi:hypothetical protein